MNYPKKNHNAQSKGNQMAANNVYQHMSSHYRRILNAKSVVDSSPPQSFKIRQSAKSRRSALGESYSGSCAISRIEGFTASQDRCLIDRIIANEKFSPSRFCGIEWSECDKFHSNGTRLMKESMHRQQMNRKDISTLKKRPADLLDRHVEQFEDAKSFFWPRILKSDAKSKLKEMRVYHPPRRRKLFAEENWAQDELDNCAERPCECKDVCVCEESSNIPNGKEASQASSRDSAYNGGTSSTTDSRSATPCRQKKCVDSCVCTEMSLTNAGTQTEMTDKSGRRSSTINRKSEADSASYLKFVHDITSEIVEKGHFTEKALNRIFQRHMTANAHCLDKSRMSFEIRNLRKQLGISQDENQSEELDAELNVAQEEQKGSIIRRSNLNESQEPENSYDWTRYYMCLNDKNGSALQSIDTERRDLELLNLSVTSNLNLNTNSDEVDEETDSSIQTTVLQGTDVKMTDVDCDISDDDSYSMSNI